MNIIYDGLSSYLGLILIGPNDMANSPHYWPRSPHQILRRFLNIRTLLEIPDGKFRMAFPEVSLVDPT